MEIQNVEKRCGLRVAKESKKLVKDLRERAKKMNGKLNESDLVQIGLSLIQDSDLKKAIVVRRKGRDRKTIMKDLWFKQNPKKSVDDFDDFTMTPKWLQFIEKNRAELSTVSS